MEGLEVTSANPTKSFWQNKRVLVTGHSGFKGSWLTLWLQRLEANVIGISLPPNTSPNLFALAEIDKLCESHFVDIRDSAKLSALIRNIQPEIVFHLAAQPLVCASYREPLETFSTNVMGTAHVLDALRGLDSVRAAVMITTDKVYRNNEWFWPYREVDALGGHDPYSASKAACEIVISSYRDAFLKDQNAAIASARAGNVIGGGDWAIDRLIPDFLRALDKGEILRVRSPNAVRPWQHVLEPLSGYLMLAEKLVIQGEDFASSWNFGPEEVDTRPVSWMVEHLCAKIPDTKWRLAESTLQSHEAGTLKLDSSKAKSLLKWAPRWSLEMALDATIEWHQVWRKGKSMAEFSIQQIEAYSATRTRSDFG